MRATSTIGPIRIELNFEKLTVFVFIFVLLTVVTHQNKLVRFGGREKCPYNPLKLLRQLYQNIMRAQRKIRYNCPLKNKRIPSA
jgi:hypothetical protein